MCKETKWLQFKGNMDFLRSRVFKSELSEHLSDENKIHLIDKEFEILLDALFSKEKPDYEFKALKVDFTKLRYHGCTVRSNTGFTIKLVKKDLDFLKMWVDGKRYWPK